MTGRFFDFTFPEELVREPTIYSLARRYDLTPIAFRALVTGSGGWLVAQLAGDDKKIDQRQGTADIEISGTLAAIDGAIESLKKEGIGVGSIEGNIIE